MKDRFELGLTFFLYLNLIASTSLSQKVSDVLRHQGEMAQSKRPGYDCSVPMSQGEVFFCLVS